MLEQAYFQRLISMNRNYDTLPLALLGKNMMAALDPFKHPTMFLHDTDELFTGDLLQILVKNSIATPPQIRTVLVASNRQFQNSVIDVGFHRFIVNREPKFDRFV